MYRLVATGEVKARVDELLESWEGEGRFHPLLREEVNAWVRENKRLALDASSQSSTALASLAELCRRDPRYLTSELVMYAVLDAKLTICHQGTRVAAPPRDRPLTPEQWTRATTREQHVRGTVTRAEDFLDELREAVRHTTGGGLQDRYPRVSVANMLDAELDVLDAARRYVGQHPKATSSEIAKATMITENEARRLKASRRCWKELAARRVAPWFRTANWEKIQRVASEGRRLRAAQRRRAKGIRIRDAVLRLRSP